MSVKISELPVLDNLADNDVLAGVDTSANVTAKVTLGSLKQYIDTNTTYTGGTNIDITNNVVSAPNVYNKTETDNLLSAKESLSNKVTSISSSSTNAQYPSAKSVYDHVSGVSSDIMDSVTEATSALQEENDELKSELDAVSTIYNAFPVDSDEDTSMTLDGTAEVKFKKLDPKGNSSQDGTPTPTSPIPVNVVSGDNSVSICGKNLFGGFEFSRSSASVTYTTHKDGSITMSGTSTAPTYSLGASDIPTYKKTLVAGTYTLSGGTSSINLVLTDSSGTNLCNTSGNNSVTVTLNSDTDIVVRAHVPNGTVTNTTVYPMLSTSGGDYEPYNGNTYNIDLPTHNYVDLSTLVQGLYQPSATPTIGLKTDARYRTFSVLLKKGTYTINFDKSCLVTRDFSSYDYSGNTTLGNFGGVGITSGTFTMTQDGTAYIGFRKNDGNNWDDNNDKVWIIDGTKVNKYTPYGTTPIELCKIGNYQDYFYKDSDKWYLHKEINKVNLSDYSFSLGSITIGGVSYSQYLSSTSSPVPILAGSYSTNLLSNYFIGKINDSSLPIEQQKNTIYVNSSRRMVVVAPELNGSYITTIEDFNIFKTNVVLYGIAYEPTSTQITYQPLIDQLNLLEQAMSKDGQTNISQVNNDKPFIINAEAILSLKNVLDRVTLLES